MSNASTWWKYGRRLINDTYVDGGDVYEASRILSLSLASKEGRDAYDGAVCQAISMLSAAGKGGIRFNAGAGMGDFFGFIGRGDRAGATLRYRSLIAEKNFKDVNALHYAMFSALDDMRKSGAATFQRLVDEEPASAQPIKVELVSMPDRKTTTAISRDESGNIVTSAQIETDLK